MAIKLPDHGIPLSYLKEERRQLVESLADLAHPPTAKQIQEIAAMHLAILAAEAVIAEKDAETR